MVWIKEEIMGDPPKKISFGFSKAPKHAVVKNKPSNVDKIQYIDCLESKTIKIKSEESGSTIEDAEQHSKTELTIPMRPNKLRPQKSQDNSSVCDDNSIESLAVKELLDESQGKKVIVQPNLVIEQTEKTQPDLQKEPTLDDYESVPISSFGLAMLRGMGWDPSKGVGKNEKKINVVEPVLRPKGLGLGAGRPTAKISNASRNAEDEKLVLNCRVEILSGTNTGDFGEVISFDEELGRVLVKIADGTLVSVNELHVKAVSKDSAKKNNIQKRSIENGYNNMKKARH